MRSSIQKNSLKLLIVAAVFQGLLTTSLPAFAASDNKQLSVTGATDQMTSNSYSMFVSSVPIGGAMGMCPSGMATSLGFWSVLGQVEVPVVLWVYKEFAADIWSLPADPFADIELSWTGQSDDFDIYRSTSPDGLVSPGNLYRTTNQCADNDQNAVPHDVLYYMITKR